MRAAKVDRIAHRFIIIMMSMLGGILEFDFIVETQKNIEARRRN